MTESCSSGACAEMREKKRKTQHHSSMNRQADNMEREREGFLTAAAMLGLRNGLYGGTDTGTGEIEMDYHDGCSLLWSTETGQLLLYF